MPAIRLACLVSILVVTGCGGGASATPASPSQPASATVQQATTLQPMDIGANLAGCLITVPARHELQLAVVVNRDGAYSAKDSHVTRHAVSRETTEPCRIISFLPQGPLRPEAKDVLVMVDGWPIHHAETHRGMSTGYGQQSLVVGQPYLQIAYMVHGGEDGGWSSDVRSPGNVALGIHVFARLVAIEPGHPHYADMQANPNASYTSSGPLTSLDEIVPPAPATSPGQF